MTLSEEDINFHKDQVYRVLVRYYLREVDRGDVDNAITLLEKMAKLEVINVREQEFGKENIKRAREIIKREINKMMNKKFPNAKVTEIREYLQKNYPEEYNIAIIHSIPNPKTMDMFGKVWLQLERNEGYMIYGGKGLGMSARNETQKEET